MGFSRLQPHVTSLRPLNNSVLPGYCPCGGPANHDNSRDVSQLDNRMWDQGGTEQRDRENNEDSAIGPEEQLDRGCFLERWLDSFPPRIQEQRWIHLI